MIRCQLFGISEQLLLIGWNQCYRTQTDIWKRLKMQEILLKKE